MMDIILSVLPLVLIALNVYCVGALMGAWTFFGVPVSFRP